MSCDPGCKHRRYMREWYKRKDNAEKVKKWAKRWSLANPEARKEIYTRYNWKVKHPLVPKGRGGLEKRIMEDLSGQGESFHYEILKIPYQEARNYIPDFLLSNGIIIEAKGYWQTADRRKIRSVVTQHPELDLRMVFSNSKNRIAKGSKTTYADYCEYLGIPYADGLVPRNWITEPYDEDRMAVAQEYLKKGAMIQ